MTSPPMPPKSSDAYLWWSLGSLDEARSRDESLSPQARELREVLEALARGRHGRQPVLARDLVITLANMYAPDALRRRHRS